MKAILGIGAILQILFLVLSPAVAHAQNSVDQMRNLGVLVRFKKEAPAKTQRQLSSFAYRQTGYIRDRKIQIWSPLERGGFSVRETVEMLRQDPSVEWAEPDYSRKAFETPNDPFFAEQWHLSNEGQIGRAHV
mgnify:CR=1 FL=1